MQLKDSSLLRTQAYIDGAWIDADDRRSFEVRNPADGVSIASVPDLGATETRRAIAAAEAALPGWRARTAKERTAILRRWFELIMANQEDLAVLMTSEQGKPLAEARGEVAYGASFIEWFAEEGKRVYGDVIPAHGADKRIVVLKEPIGVVAAITPWNFPIAMITRKAGPALAAGCTMVIKPAEDTPLCALALAELAERAGVPRGVLNVVTTNRAAEVGGEHRQPVAEANPFLQLQAQFSTALEQTLDQFRDCRDRWSAPSEVIHPVSWSEDHFGWNERWQGSGTSRKRSSPSCGR